MDVAEHRFPLPQCRCVRCDGNSVETQRPAEAQAEMAEMTKASDSITVLAVLVRHSFCVASPNQVGRNIIQGPLGTKDTRKWRSSRVRTKRAKIAGRKANKPSFEGRSQTEQGAKGTMSLRLLHSRIPRVLPARIAQPLRWSSHPAHCTLRHCLARSHERTRAVLLCTALGLFWEHNCAKHATESLRG